MNRYTHLTDSAFNTVCDALDVLSGGAELFYILNHPYEFDTYTASLAEYVDGFDCYRQTNY